MLAERRPLVDPDLEARLELEVRDQRGEELQVVARDDHPQRRTRGGRIRAVAAGAHRPRQVAAQPVRGLVQRELPGRGGRPGRREGEHGGVGGARRRRVRDVVQAGGEQRVVGAEQRLVHRRPVQDHRQPQLAELQHLGRQLQRRVEVRVPPGQPDVTASGQPHRLGARLPAMPDHAGHGRRPHLAEGRAHPPLVARVPRVVVHLVADHVHLGGDPAAGQQRRQPGHLQRVPPRRELARVDELQGDARRSSRTFRRIESREHGREQDGLTASGRDAAFEEAAQFLGLAEQVAGGLRDRGEVLGGLRGHRGDGLRDVGQVGPQPPVEGAVAGGGRDQRPAAEHHQVVAAAVVDGGEHGDGLGDGEAGVGEFRQELFGVRAANGDRLDVAQRRDEPVGADLGLQHQRDRAPGGGEGLGHRLQPDGRAVEQVHVDVGVDQGAGSGSGHCGCRSLSVHRVTWGS